MLFEPTTLMPVSKVNMQIVNLPKPVNNGRVTKYSFYFITVSAVVVVARRKTAKANLKNFVN